VSSLSRAPPTRHTATRRSEGVAGKSGMSSSPVLSRTSMPCSRPSPSPTTPASSGAASDAFSCCQKAPSARALGGSSFPSGSRGLGKGGTPQEAVHDARPQQPRRRKRTADCRRRALRLDTWAWLGLADVAPLPPPALQGLQGLESLSSFCHRREAPHARAAAPLA